MNQTIMTAPLLSTTTRTVQVISPASLEEGCTFPAQVDDLEFTVTVPAGGVQKDEVFSVTLDTNTKTANTYNFRDENVNKNDNFGLAEAQLVPGAMYEAAVVSTTNNKRGDATDFNHIPTGQWRTELCDCMCIMAWICPSILFAQIMQRMKFNYCGRPAAIGSPPNSACAVLTLITFCGIPLLYFITALATSDPESSAIPTTVAYILKCAWGIYLIVVFTCMRMSIRRKYNIQPAFTDCCIEDFCMVQCCCVPCSAIQLANHTHNRMVHKNRYNACSQTGLFSGASEVV